MTYFGFSYYVNKVWFVINISAATWMKWMWSSVRDSCVISLSRRFRSAISWVSRSMWPSALLSAALLLDEISLAISCCIFSMERSMSLKSFSHSCMACWAELWTRRRGRGRMRMANT